MKKRNRLLPVLSLRARLLILIIGLTLVRDSVVAVIAINTAQSAGQFAQQVSGDALREQVESSLVQLTESNANENDLLLRQVTLDAEQVAGYIQSIYSDRALFNQTSVWSVDEHIFSGPDGQYMNGPEEVTSVFLPANRDWSAQVEEDFTLSAYLDLILPKTFTSNPNVEAIYFATPRDVVRYYPNIELGNVLPPDFRATERVWYTGSSLEENPTRSPWWTPVYVDATGLGLVTTAAAPVYDHQDELIGVIGFDITLNEMVTNIEMTENLGGGYLFLIDGTGKAIALPDQGFQDILGRSPETDEIAPDLNRSTTGFLPILEKMLAGDSGYENLTVDQRELFVAYAPLSSTGWSLGSVVDADIVLQEVRNLNQELEADTQQTILFRLLPMSAVGFLLMIVLTLLLTNRLTRPLQQLTVAARQIGQGEWEADLPETRNDEIGVLSGAFNVMKVQLQELISSLEQRVLERTRDLEDRTKQLQVAAEVGSAVTLIRDLDSLLPRVTQLISDRFGFYHVGIFLIEEEGKYAELRAANSPGGKRMLARQHRLKVGEEGIVGFVTEIRRPHIALDVGQDAVYFNNPDLPETRSEIALPLIAGEKLLGALDVQSTEPAAFGDDDIEILRVVADQVAVAIENARLFTENQTALDAIRRAYGEITREAWNKLLEGRGDTAYLATSESTPRKVTGGAQSGVSKNFSDSGIEFDDPSSLVLPIKIRDKCIGMVRMRKPEESGDWRAEEIELMYKLIEQLSLALENARLHETAQRKAERERFVTKITTKMRETTEPEQILQTAVHELQAALGAKKVQIQFDQSDGTADLRPNGDTGQLKN